jgi:Tol biopolymer transport system component
MTIDGSETVRLTSTRAVEADPAVSPDTLTIAYRRGADELWLANLLGTEQRRILPARPRTVRYATTSSPAWSPDGRFLYVARAAQGPNEICGGVDRLRSDGSKVRRVTKGIALYGDPAPSPDGTRIAMSYGECEPGLPCSCLVAVDPAGRPTSDLRKLPTRYRYSAPAWSPDSRQVAVEAHVDDTSSAIFVAARTGAGLRRVSPKGLRYAESPAWSSDGEWIAFSAWRKQTGYDLYLVHPDGGGLQRVTSTSGDERSPAWLRRT